MECSNLTLGLASLDRVEMPAMLARTVLAPGSSVPGKL